MTKKYLTFKHIESKPKTEVYLVLETKYDEPLGTIKWHATWRQYSFFPEFHTIFSRGCMQEIVNFIEKLMDDRRVKRAYGEKE